MRGIGLSFLWWLPSLGFVLFLIHGTGGETGGIIALVLGFITAVMGLPWNFVFTWLWGMLPEALQPHWLVGQTTGGWTGFAVFFLASIAGCFLNGALLGWLLERSRKRRELASSP